ncbi:MAG TPA: hypothetical protein VL461_12630 [Dictyobacter sp.]|nr:hypothetical protein [Dictyobacter sp.]
MQFYRQLQKCLQAVANRYPGAFVECNEELIGFPDLHTACWRTIDFMVLLQDRSPEMLQTMALLSMDEHQCEIYLPDRSDVTPALIVYCQEHVLA